jgi:hypothetical protein
MSVQSDARFVASWQTRLLPARRTASWLDYPWLVALTIGVELAVPLLIWKGGAPSAIRWVADLLVLTVMVLTLVRVLVAQRAPFGLLYVLMLSTIGIIVAGFEGQHAGATVWGWWVAFRYPFFGIYTYLQPVWPRDFARKFFLVCMGLFAAQLLVQLLQFAAGQVPSDDLAGFFGRHGVGPLTMLLFFCLCLAFGQWIVAGDWRYLLGMIVAGAISSSLGEMKIFLPGLFAIGFLALVIYALRRGDVGRIVRILLLLFLVPPLFAVAYNQLVADVRGTRRLEEFLNPETMEQYLTRAKYSSERDQFQLGRNFALTYGWQSIQRDGATLLFGMGTGARSESTSLGLTGAGYLQDNLGLTSSTSILVLIQEYGVVGLTSFGLLMAGMILVLWTDSRREPDAPITVLRVGLILYSLMWPVWLWYHQVWGFTVPMILYWATMGYVLNHRAPPLRRRRNFWQVRHEP